jgi:diguanylate cyclase (GGDEF)-like protein
VSPHCGPDGEPGPAQPAARAVAAAATTACPASPADALAAWRALLDALPAAAWIVDARTARVVADNTAARRLLGDDASSLVGRRADGLIESPEDRIYWDEAAAGELGVLDSEAALPGPDARPVARSIRPLRPPLGGAPQHLLVVVADRSAERREADERERVVAELQATLESTADGLLVTDLHGGIRAFNRRFAQLWAIPEALLHARRDDAVRDWMRRALPDDQQRWIEACGPDAGDGDREPRRLTLHGGAVLERVVRPLRRHGLPAGWVWSFRDRSEQLAARRRIEQLAATDPLTGLPNRRRLAAHVARAVQRQRRGGAGFALLLVDLDRFRQINASLGQAAGDRALVDMARRLAALCRAGDLLARSGGDQFALLVDGADAAGAEAAARRVLDAVAEPLPLHGMPFTLTCSVGGALCPGDGRNADELLRHAEAAVQAVKAAGRAAFRLHRGRRSRDARADLRLEHAMRQALAAGRFRLAYQPQVELHGGRVVGAEALIRWRDPELGEVPPARFIPVAEDCGFVVALGDWVLDQAVGQAAAWRAAGFEMPVAVNVSALQFQRPGFVDRVAAALAASALPPRLLELELTESILVHDADEALQRLRALAALGVRLAIDDFGTGYSSLAYLKRFPIAKLKVDRSFVQGLPGTDSDGAIVVAILQMAAALGLRTVAEGVETDAQRRFLAAHGCHEAQGFLFAPALDCRSFEARFRQAPAAEAPPPGRRRIRLVSG